MSQPRIRGYEISPPKGGWRLHMDIKGQRFDFYGSPTKIVQDIAQLQKKNDIYEGDDAIWDFCNKLWCKRDPDRCLKGTLPNTTMRSKVVTYAHALHALVKNGLQPVEQKLAVERALICKKCPENKQVEKCGTCMKTVNALTKLLIGKRTTIYDRKLKQCGICKCDLKQKIHYPLNEGDKNNYPSNCWVTKEKKAQDE